ncbi:hypothetical protein C8Q80DRAFT_1108373 [Daedaleopsis nitida]|nr:hypothetical protein C8Q80DRAFT_1108373 [Daedaleopsis nitida]
MNALPPPPPGFVYVAAVTPSMNLLLVGTACASSLIPTAVALFFFSTADSRAQPVFVLNVSLILLGLALGALNIVVQTRIVQALSVHPGITTAYALLTVAIPALSDCVLLLRVAAVYPPRVIPLRRSVAIYVPTALIKAARILIDILFIVDWARAVSGYDRDSPFEASQEAWDTPLPKLAWFLQLVDSAYASGLFLAKLREGRVNNALTRGGASCENTNSYYHRLRTLFWISMSNFVFPVILNLVQLILAFRDKSFLDGAYVLIVNIYVTIIGVLFATIWSMGTKGLRQPVRPVAVAAGNAPLQSPRFASGTARDGDSDADETLTMATSSRQSSTSSGWAADVESQITTPRR